MAHYFHMLCDEKTIGNLMEAGGLTKIKKVPGLIRDIVIDFYYKVEKLHFTGESRKSRYEKISEVGPKENKRKSLWIPLPEEVYQRLKQIHKDLDFYSISQIVRFIVCKFLWYKDRLSDDEFEVMIDQDQSAWEAERLAFMADSKKLSQWIKKGNLSAKKLRGYLVSYSSKAVPIEILGL